MNPFVLDEKIGARSISFGLLTQLIMGLRALNAFVYSQIVDHPAPELAKVWQTGPSTVLRRTSRYRYFYALKALGLITPGAGGYTLSKEGRAVAETARSVEAEQELSQDILAIYRRVVRSCELVRRNFLVLFTGDPALDPWEQGVPFSFLPVAGDQQHGSGRQYELRSSLWSGPLILSEPQTQGVLWGLRQWCQTVGLIDELLIRPQAEVSDTDASILFPVKPELSDTATLAQFDILLRSELASLTPAYGQTVSMSIPLLLYRLCPKGKLAVETAKTLLIDWLARNREHTFAEGPSLAVLESSRFRRGTSLDVWRKQQRGFLQIGDRDYSRLFVSLSGTGGKEGVRDAD